ncbi:MAG: amidohydrolase family protein [Acidobacteria bacterium]|nr:amidohydrolase family protein [Acidobacteriota bacterium]
MRRFLVLLTSAVTLSGHAGWAQDRPALVDRMGYADMVLVNGKIVSMDDRSTTPDSAGRTYQAMAIKGRKIMALGAIDEMKALAGPETRIEDLGGRIMIPGLIQTHFHLFGGAAVRYGPQFGLTDPSVKLTVTAESSPEATAKKIRDTVVNAIQVQSIPKGQWITLQVQEGQNVPGTARTWFGKGKLNRRQLDASTLDHPILVRSNIGGYFNAEAIKLFTEEFHDWLESTEIETGAGSAQNGYAAVPEMGGLTFEFWWKDKPTSDLAEVLRLYGVDVANMGITTVATRLLYPKVIEAYAVLNREAKMPHRLAYYIESQRGNFFNTKSIREFYRGMGAPWTNHANGGEMFWLNGMCNELWDSTQYSVCLGPDVPAPPEIKARERCPAPGLKSWEAVKAGLENGWRPAQIHGNSSHGARLFIQLLDQVAKDKGYSVEYVKNLRPTLEHNALLGKLPDVIEGLKKYGIIVNVNTGNFAEVPPLIQDYGEKLREFAMPVKTWINNGIRVTFEASGMNFWRPIHALVTRKTPVSRTYPEPVLLLPEEAVDRVTALKMATTWASEYVMAEDTVGSLEAGKYADFVVLDRDYFQIPVDDILKVTVVMTGLNGKIVYDNRSGNNPARDAVPLQPGN